MKKEIRAWLFLAVLQISWIGPCLYDVYTCRQKEEIVIEENGNSFDTEKTEVEEKVMEVPNPIYKDIRFYDVPLDEDLQMHTFVECDGYSIAPAIVFAIMDVESNYDVNALSQYGDIGIMQINPTWHEERMEILNCTDLYNPYQNITVAINYLAWLIDINPDVYWVLMAYNKGPDKATELLDQGIITDYAIEVLEYAEELENKYYAIE